MNDVADGVRLASGSRVADARQTARSVRQKRRPAKPASAGVFEAVERKARLFLGNLVYLMALEANGFHAEAGALVDKIIVGLARSAPGELAGGPASLPAEERGRSADDLKRLDRLNARMSRPLPKGDKRAEDARERTAKEREALERAPAARADEAWRKRSAIESASLAKARGEEVQTTRSGAIRVISRDPILSMLRLGKLTSDHYDAAVICRDLYEARSEGLGSQMGGLGSVGQPGYDNSNAVFAGVQRAKKLQRITAIELAILTGACRMMDGSTRMIEAHLGFAKAEAQPHVGLSVFRAICSEGKSMSSQGEGRAFERNLKAFVLALDVAREIVGRS